MTANTRPCASFIVYVLLFGACLACASCGTCANGTPATPNAAKPDETPTPPVAAPDTAGVPSTQIANPASVNCEKKGGKLEMRTEPAGQFGVCVFPDGSRCEEWRFFRDECKQGECRADDGKCEAKNN
jgi:putative hemolysin